MARILYVAKLAVDKDSGLPIPALAGEAVTIVRRGTSMPAAITEDEAGTLVISGAVRTVSAELFIPSFWVDTAEGPVSALGGGIEVPLESVEGVAHRLDTLEVETGEAVTAAQAAQAAAESAASAAGTALPAGGSTGQSLVKLSAADRHVGWSTVSGGGGGGSVTSVAGRTGDVSLVKGDVGLGSVDNTSDTNKPVSTATQTALNGKANTSHTHTVANVAGLQDALDSKAGLNAAVNASQVNAGTGVINPVRLGTGSSITTKFLRGDGTWQTVEGGGGGSGAVDSVNGQTGDVVLDAEDVGALPDTYTAPVSSVAGRTGVVTLNKNDVGLDQVTNTSDVNKPVSNATQTALDAKAADSAVVKLTGNQTVAGVKTFSSAPVVPDASFSMAKVSGLANALPWTGTQSEYNALTPITGRVYVIVP